MFFNISVLILFFDRIRALPTQFLGLPAQSIRLKLNDVLPPAGQKVWTKPILEAVMQALGNKELIACLKVKYSVHFELTRNA